MQPHIFSTELDSGRGRTAMAENGAGWTASADALAHHHDRLA